MSQAEQAGVSEAETATASPPAERVGTALFVGLALTVAILDQLTKSLVIRWLPHQTGWPELDRSFGGVFRFYHSHNTGVAFGLFQGRNGLFVLVACAVVLALLWYQHTLPAGDRLTRLALGLQVGGAAGNIVDRLRQGYVTDFLDFHLGGWHWPTFNLADSAIVLGVGLLMLQLWRAEAQREASPSVVGGGEPRSLDAGGIEPPNG